MPKIHRNWNKLKEKLLLVDQKVVADKVVGIDRTLVVVVPDLKYDKTIPILSDDHLQRWYQSHRHDHNGLSRIRSPSPSSSSSSSPSLTPRSSRSPERNQDRENNDLIGVGNEPVVEPVQSDDDTNTVQTKELEISQEKSEDSSRFKDELVFTNSGEDEFAKYKDDDAEEPESILSKNLKKIRTVVPSTTTNNVSKTSTKPQFTAPKPPHLPAAPKPPLATQSNGYAPQKELQPQSSTSNTVQVEPNWQETKKLLEQNQLAIAFKDLNHFKAQIKNDTLSKPLLTDLIIKCFQEDLTLLLEDSLKLICELNIYYDEYEFWSELVMRFKRKLFTPTNVKNLTFKTKTDPEPIYENYKRILMSFSKFILDQNLTLKLPYQIFRFIDEPLRLLEAQASVKAEVDKKPEIKKVKVENLVPKSEQNVTPQPAQRPDGSANSVLQETNGRDGARINGRRTVSVVGSVGGKDIFRIRPTSTPIPCSNKPQKLRRL